MPRAGFEQRTSHTNDGRSRPLKPLVILLFKVPFFLIRDIYRNCLKTGRSKTDLSGSRRTSVQYSDPFLCPKSGSPKSRHSKHLKTGHKARPFQVKMYTSSKSPKRSSFLSPKKSPQNPKNLFEIGMFRTS